MPVWRPRPDWFRAAVGAAITDPGCEVELIVVDDGNDEPVAPLLDGVADERVRVLRVPHGGVSAARNAGTEAARAAHLRFVDADDACEPGSSGHLLALAEGRQDVIAYGATRFCDVDLNPVWTMTSDLQGDLVRDCLLGRWQVRPFSLLFPRGVLDAAGPWDPALTVQEDFDFCLRAVEHARVRGDHTVVTRYRKHPTSATRDTAAGEEGARAAVRKYFERHPEQRGTRLEREVEAVLAAKAARVHLTRRRPGAAVRAAARSAVRDPRFLLEEIRFSLPALRRRVRQASSANNAGQAFPSSSR
jgi:hypothetical protein